MISHSHRYVFIQVPKTGSSTIKHTLCKHTTAINDYDIVKRHSNYNRYLEVYPESENYFKFCFVRNPWDWLVSFYTYKQRRGKWQKLDFKTFVLRKHIRGFFGWIDSMSSPYSVFRFEDMQSDYDQICEQIGINKTKLPHRNKTKHKHYTKYYDDETRSIVAKKYARDIEYFGYKFGD